MACGNAIRRGRMRQGLYQKELAAAVKVTPNTVSNWERGLTFPGPKVVRPLAIALGMTVDDLLPFIPGGTDADENDSRQGRSPEDHVEG